jgi:hypothetical protein
MLSDPDAAVAYDALLCIKTMCRARDKLSSQYFRAQQSGGETSLL